MSAYLYKSGKLIVVASIEHIDELKSLGIDTISSAISLGFVRIRRIGDVTAFQARSKDLLRRAMALYFSTYQPTNQITIEFPGRYLQLSPEELCDWL